jgi:MFS family permease
MARRMRLPAVLRDEPQFLPFAVLALPAGVWADRLDRKRILIASDLVRLCTQLTAGLLPATVSALHLQPANALRGLTFSIGAIAGSPA